MPSSLNRYEYACVRRSRGERGSFDDTKPTRRSTFLFSTFSHIRALQRRVRIATYVWRALLKRQRFRSVIRSHRLTLLQPHCEGEKKTKSARSVCISESACGLVAHRGTVNAASTLSRVTRNTYYIIRGGGYRRRSLIYATDRRRENVIMLNERQ